MFIFPPNTYLLRKGYWKKPTQPGQGFCEEVEHRNCSQREVSKIQKQYGIDYKDKGEENTRERVRENEEKKHCDAAGISD